MNKLKIRNKNHIIDYFEKNLKNLTRVYKELSMKLFVYIYHHR